ncbi:MAG TPA: helix-turn-helix domain-containing protein, partial [Methanomassiliicoccaceae archaeon]|nr:helix-turn-helix domain-containing protein [Methanomassiliicoccaceae archaeon]
NDDLTMRQEQITRMAFERGYFDHPRRIGLKELADQFGISISTLSEILRKGQRRIMQRYFEEHRQY